MAGNQLGPLKGLDQVRGHPGLSGLLDQIALAEGGQDEYGHLFSQVGDGPRRSQPVGAGHLDVENGDVGTVSADQVDDLVTTARLSHHVVALVLEDLFEVEPDDGLVLGNDHAPGHGVCTPLAFLDVLEPINRGR